jgi:hypothetical protein
METRAEIRRKAIGCSMPKFNANPTPTPGRNEPGTGEINNRFAFGFIDRIRYDVWIGCEYKPKGNTEDDRGRVRACLGA